MSIALRAVRGGDYAMSAPTGSSAGPIVDADHPWLGLHPFTEETQRFFFGRDAEIREIFVRVREHPLTILYGQSGLGKTSLLRAGLMPKLRVERFRPVILRFLFDSTVPSLAAQLRGALAEACASAQTGAAVWLGRWQSASGLWEILHHVDLVPPDLATSSPVLIFDQFEELFTIAQNAGRAREAEALIREIADLVENRPPPELQERLRTDRMFAREFDSLPSPLRVVITLREDYLSHLEVWKKHLPTLMRNRMSLYLLNGSQALEAAVCPGRIEGRNLVSDEVGALIVRFVAKKSEETPIEEIGAVPPLLSLLCDELSRKRPAGGVITEKLVRTEVGDILRNFYERSFEGTPTALRNYIEDHLVTSVGGHRSPIVRVEAEAVLRRQGVADPELLLDQLVERRLITVEERSGIGWIEITHDVLTDLVMKSRKEREERERAVRLQKEKEEAEAREAAVRAERTRLRYMLATMALLLVVALVLCVTCVCLYSNANDLAVEARKGSSLADLKSASLLYKDGKYGNALRYLARAIARYPANRGACVFATSLVADRNWAINSLPPLAFDQDPQLVAFSADDAHFLVLGNDTVRVWDRATGREITPPLKHPTKVYTAAFSRDGKYIATGSEDRLARIFSTTTGELVSPPLKHGGPVFDVAFDPKGGTLATASGDEKIRLFQVPSGSCTRTIDAGYRPDWITFDASGQRLATSGEERSTIWNLSADSSTEMPKHNGGSKFCRFSPDTAKCLSVGEDMRVFLSSDRNWFRLTHTQLVSNAEFSPDSRWVVTSSEDGFVRIWGMHLTATPGRLLQGYDVPVYDADPDFQIEHHVPVVTAGFSPDGGRLLTVTQDGIIQLWNAYKLIAIASGTPSGTHSTIPGIEWDTQSASLNNEFACEPVNLGVEIISAKLSHNGRYLLAIAKDRSVHLWDVSGTQLLPEPVLHRDEVTKATLSPNPVAGSLATVTRDDYSAHLWLRSNGQFAARDIVLPHSREVNDVEFSPDGKWLVTACNDGIARVWNAQTGEEQPATPMLRHSAGVIRASFVKIRGRLWILTVSTTEVFLWPFDQIGAAPIGPLKHPFLVNTVAASRDGESLLAAAGPEVFLWNLGASANHQPLKFVTETETQTESTYDEFGRRITRVIEHPMNYVAFTEDGTEVVACSGENLYVWDISRPSVNPRILRHPEDVRHVYMGIGRRAVTLAGATLRCWDLGTGKYETEPLLHPDTVLFAALARDGRFVVTACSDRKVRIWDLETGYVLFERTVAGGEIADLEITDGGSRFVVASANVAYVWDSPVTANLPPELLSRFALAVCGVPPPVQADSTWQEGMRPELRNIRDSLLGTKRDPWATWLSQMAQSGRGISPLCNLTLDNYIRKIAKTNSREVLEQALVLEPSDLEVHDEIRKLLNTDSSSTGQH